MSNKQSLRNTLMILSMLGALGAGTGTAAAQVIDNPPGSEFQDQGIREDNGLPRFGEEYREPRGAYGYVTRRNTVVVPREWTGSFRGQRDRFDN